MTADELRKKFLEDVAPTVLKIYTDSLHGIKNEKVDTSKLCKMWVLVENLILGAKDVRKITAETTQDVVKLMADGSVPMDVIRDAMAILKDQRDIEDIVKIREMLEEMQGNDTLAS